VENILTERFVGRDKRRAKLAIKGAFTPGWPFPGQKRRRTAKRGENAKIERINTDDGEESRG